MVAPVIVFDDVLLVATALLADDAVLDELIEPDELAALLLELLPVPTVIEKSFDDVLPQVSVAINRTTSVSFMSGAVTVTLGLLVLDSVACPLRSVILDHV